MCGFIENPKLMIPRDAPLPILLDRIDPFGWVLALFTDREQMIRFLTEYKHDFKPADLRDEGTRGYCAMVRIEAMVVIGIFCGDLSCLVHELTHGITGMLDECGVPLSYANSEVLAYHMTHSFARCRLALNESARRG